MKRIALFVALVILVSSAVAYAKIPGRMSYQGVLNQADGSVVADGEYEITFTIYYYLNQYVEIWSEVHNSVDVENGVFNAILGSEGEPLTALVFSGQYPRYLGIQIGSDPELSPKILFTTSPYSFWSAVADSAVVCASGGSESGWTVVGDEMYAAVTGNVGIGTDDPLVKLHIENEDLSLPQGILYKEKLTIESDDSILGLYSAQGGSAGSGIVLGEIANGELVNKWGIVRGTPDGGNTLRFTFGTDQGYWTQNPTIMCLDDGGNVGIGTLSPTRKLTVRGNILIQSESTGEDILELGEGLDYAEGFDISDIGKIDFGTVLTIDSENPGELTVSTEPYDFKVAGIIAGANGLGSGVRLGAGQFEYDVALAGRVYCKVDASFGAVVPGDLLTTSPTAGHAMKATDRDRAHGAILGKAMQGLAEGEQGEILVLVTLQ